MADQIFERLDSFSKAILMNIHENIADLLTSLLVFSEEELLQANCAKDLDFSSCMSENQFSLAHFYCQNHKALAENFIKNIVPKVMAQNQQQRRIC